MRISTKSQHVILALIDIAHNGPVAISKVAERQKVAVSYLEFLIARPRVYGMVSGCRGSDGSYKLSLASDQINIGDIVYAVEGTKPRRSANDPRPSSDYRLLNFLMQLADDKAIGLVANVTLGDIRNSKLQTPAATILEPIRKNVFTSSDNQNGLPVSNAAVVISPVSINNNCADNVKLMPCGSSKERKTRDAECLSVHHLC